MTTLAPVRQEKSTTVRQLQPPGRVRAFFRVADRLAPRLAAYRAERIWFTLPAPRPAGPEADPGGSPFTVRFGAREVAGRSWGRGPAVYLVHGWAGHTGHLAAFVTPLVERGFRVVGYDAPSHGRSAAGSWGPRSSSLPEFTEALAAVAGVHGPAHAIVAHSMGATAAAAALCDGLPAGRVALLAPMAGPLSYARRFATTMGFGDRTLRHLIARVERRVGAPLHHFDAPELGRAVAMPPTLVVHDRYDAYTPVSDGAAIAAAWRDARLEITSGLGHRRLLRDPDVVARVVAFVAG